jgi:hypothetical protein
MWRDFAPSMRTKGYDRFIQPVRSLPLPLSAGDPPCLIYPTHELSIVLLTGLLTNHYPQFAQYPRKRLNGGNSGRNAHGINDLRIIPISPGYFTDVTPMIWN